LWKYSYFRGANRHYFIHGFRYVHCIGTLHTGRKTPSCTRRYFLWVPPCTSPTKLLFMSVKWPEDIWPCVWENNFQIFISIDWKALPALNHHGLYWQYSNSTGWYQPEPRRWIYCLYIYHPSLREVTDYFPTSNFLLWLRVRSSSSTPNSSNPIVVNFLIWIYGVAIPDLTQRNVKLTFHRTCTTCWVRIPQFFDYFRLKCCVNWKNRKTTLQEDILINFSHLVRRRIHPRLTEKVNGDRRKIHCRFYHNAYPATPPPYFCPHHADRQEIPIPSSVCLMHSRAWVYLQHWWHAEASFYIGWGQRFPYPATFPQNSIALSSFISAPLKVISFTRFIISWAFLVFHFSACDWSGPGQHLWKCNGMRRIRTGFPI